MEILSKLVTRQVHSLNIQLGFLKHTNNKFNQACSMFYNSDYQAQLWNNWFYTYLLSAGVENAKTVGWLSEMCVSDAATFFWCIVTGIM